VYIIFYIFFKVEGYGKQIKNPWASIQSMLLLIQRL